MMKRKVAFIHTSPAAIGPLMQFYTQAAPELEITNLLDDGILRLLATNNQALAQQRLANMIDAATEAYEVELVMVTCSSISKEMIENLNEAFRLPILKIDLPMARQAVRRGRKVGVAATFPPTLVPTSQLLTEAATEAGTEVEIIREVNPAAYDALLANDTATHDELLFGVFEKLESQGVSAIVLAQVSMARILPQLEGRVQVPVLSSLQTSLEAVRKALEASAVQT